MQQQTFGLSEVVWRGAGAVKALVQVSVHRDSKASVGESVTAAASLPRQLEAVTIRFATYLVVRLRLPRVLWSRMAAEGSAAEGSAWHGR